MVKKAGLVMAVVAGGLLACTPSALAHEALAADLIAAATPVANVGAPSGNVVQIPIVTMMPLQVCDNNVAAGLVAIVVDPNAGLCTS